MSKAVDLFVTYKFLKLLTTKWKDTDAFKEGVIDKNGKLLIPVKDFTTKAQEDAYTPFNRLVFNIKRIIEKVPFGKPKIGSYAAALFLLREETGMSEEEMLNVLDQAGLDTDINLNEHALKPWPGGYLLNHPTQTREKGSIVTLESTDPVGNFAGIDIYKTKDDVYISKDNIE